VQLGALLLPHPRAIPAQALFCTASAVPEFGAAALGNQVPSWRLGSSPASTTHASTLLPSTATVSEPETVTLKDPAPLS